METTPEKAKELLEKDHRFVYLDVRTVPEFNNGRVPGAMNIPIAELNPATGQMEFNPKFLPVAEAVLPKDSYVIVGCRSGPRSAAAAELLREAGYKHVVNQIGGFAGETDETGQVITEGWSTLGFPVERGQAADKSYSSLTIRAAESAPPAEP